MRSFTDDSGKAWTATVQEWPGEDYKGRFELVFEPQEPSERPGAPLTDVRWNSRETAERTLHSMSRVELCRRLRSALGRTVRQGEGV
jgi:hypothetical protein